MEPLLSVREAQENILAKFTPLPTEKITFDHSIGRVLAQDLSAPYDLPRFTNSAMDGYAIHSRDVLNASGTTPVRLKVVGEIPAGSNASVEIGANEAVRIMTGAAVPDSADAVVPIEDVQTGLIGDQGYPLEISILSAVPVGNYLRVKGTDIPTGGLILSKGNRITPAAVGVLAMFGMIEQEVYRIPRISILSSGEELIHPTEPLHPGKIRDANTYMLSSLVKNEECQVVYTGIARDQERSVKEQFDRAFKHKPDIILTSAGVSVGAYDFVRAFLLEHGKLFFWRVNMRPGKPVAFGEYRGIPIIGLPGNPVSAFVGFNVFVRPVLNRLAGDNHIYPMTHPSIITEAIESDGRESYLRANVEQINGKLIAHQIKNQNSGNLLSVIQANALLIVPSGVKSLPAGSTLDTWLLNN